MADKYPEAEIGEPVLNIVAFPFQNDEAEAIKKGDGVTLTDGAGIFPWVGHCVDVSEPLFGIAMEAIAQGETGMVLVIGIIKVTLGDTVTPFVKLMPAGDALLDPASAGNNAFVCGIALQKGAAGDTALVYINPAFQNVDPGT